MQRSRLWFAAVCVAGLGVLGAGWPVGADSTSRRDTPWARVTGPAEGPAQSFGGYSAGCVQGAQALPLDGPGFQLVRPSRNRHFGHPALIDFVTGLGQKVRKADLGVLMIGDLGQPRGGPAPSGHASHQSGLDVDIWFWAPPGAARKVLPVAERELLSEHAVVSARAKTRTRHWSPRIARVLALAAADERVARIFVNPVIKRELCQEAGTEAGPKAGEARGWLRKLRPWWGHDAHFHVRLACPADSPECEGQPELPAGDGCDEIADWLDEEKQEQLAQERAQYRERLRGVPEMPAACSALLP